MKIALDLRRIENLGIGRYMKCLTKALVTECPEHEYLLILPPGAEQVIDDSANVQKLVCWQKYYSLREQLALPKILRRHNIDVLHAPHFNFVLASPCPCVVTIHDVVYLACPEDLPSSAGRIYYRGMMNAAVRFADKLITDSQFSREEIRRWVKPDAEPEVIYPGIDHNFAVVNDDAQILNVKSRFGIEREYILYTGIYKPRKNHAGLLSAFRNFLDRGGDADLVIAGPLKHGQSELRRLASQLRITDRVIFTGFVPECDLPALYSGARVYACPSLYEGFGFTVLEAMACGAPVVCSRGSSLREVAGKAAIYANARDADEFGSALHRAFTGKALRTELQQNGRANAAQYSWRTTALQTLAVYRQAAENRTRQPAAKGTGVCAG